MENKQWFENIFFKEVTKEIKTRVVLNAVRPILIYGRERYLREAQAE